VSVLLLKPTKAGYTQQAIQFLQLSVLAIGGSPTINSFAYVSSFYDTIFDSSSPKS